MKRLCLLFVLLVFGVAALPAQAPNDLQRQLLAAVERNDISEVKSLVKDGADVNMTIPSRSPFYIFFLSRELYLQGLQKGMQGEEIYVGAIHANATRANSKMLKTLLKYGANIDAGDSRGKTPLMYALRSRGGEEYALDLIRMGANYTARDEVGNTALHYAAFGGNMEGIRMTVTGGTDINAANDQGITPLMAAAVRAPLPIMQALVDLGADLFAKDKQGMNALHYASGYGRRDKIKWLLAQAPGLLSEDNTGMNPLDIARLADNDEVVIHYRRNGVKFNAYFYEELVEAVRQNDLETVEEYLFKGANPNRPAEKYPIHYAAEAGQGKMIRLLLRYDARGDVVDPELRTPLDLCLKMGHADAALALVDGGFSPGGDAVIAAIDHLVETGESGKWLPVVEGLARNSSDLSTPGGKMNIPALHHAAYLGLKPVVQSLLKAGADPNLTDRDGWTALHWAVMKGDLKSSHPEKVEIIRQLIKAGGQLHIQATSPKTLPHTQPYLARRVPAHATAMDIIDYALPKDLDMEALLAAKDGERQLSGEDYRGNGIELFLTEDYRTAMLEFNRALGKDTASGEAYYYRGLCKAALSMYQEAERDHAAALEIQPDYPEAILGRGKALFELADYDNAILHFNQAIRMEHEVGRALYLRGKSKLRAGRRSGACKDFTAAIAAGSPEAETAHQLYCK